MTPEEHLEMALKGLLDAGPFDATQVDITLGMEAGKVDEYVVSFNLRGASVNIRQLAMAPKERTAAGIPVMHLGDTRVPSLVDIAETIEEALLRASIAARRKALMDRGVHDAEDLRG